MIIQGFVIINLSCPTGNGRYKPAQLSTLLRIWALDMRNSDSPSLIHKGSPRLRVIRARDSKGRIQKITAKVTIQILSKALLNCYPAATYDCNFCMIIQGLVIINISCPTGNGRYEQAQFTTQLNLGLGHEKQ